MSKYYLLQKIWISVKLEGVKELLFIQFKLAWENQIRQNTYF